MRWLDLLVSTPGSGSLRSVVVLNRNAAAASLLLLLFDDLLGLNFDSHGSSLLHLHIGVVVIVLLRVTTASLLLLVLLAPSVAPAVALLEATSVLLSSRLVVALVSLSARLYLLEIFHVVYMLLTLIIIY